jgi:regulator of nonsense transcripts 2
MDELKSVNLSKFVSEAVSYICEAKLRSADIQAAVQVIGNNSGYTLCKSVNF